jgi:hypothetical protein
MAEVLSWKSPRGTLTHALREFVEICEVCHGDQHTGCECCGYDGECWACKGRGHTGRRFRLRCRQQWIEPGSIVYRGSGDGVDCPRCRRILDREAHALAESMAEVLEGLAG